MKCHVPFFSYKDKRRLVSGPKGGEYHKGFIFRAADLPFTSKFLLIAISEGSLLALLMPSRESRGNLQQPPGGSISWFVWRKPARCLATKIVRYDSTTCWGGLFSCRYYVGEFHKSRLRLACNASPSLGHGFLIICPSRLGSCLVTASVNYNCNGWLTIAYNAGPPPGFSKKDRSFRRPF